MAKSKKQAANPAGYSGTPLPKKLGIKADATVLLIGAPENFITLLEPLPEGVTLRNQARGPADLAILFVTSRRALEERLERIAALAGGLWLAWPKKASGVATDLTENVVRDIGLAAGLVDFKVCAIDSTWSGLRFARRR